MHTSNTASRVAHQPVARRLSLDDLGILSFLALIWLFLCITPLPPNDLWWHMAAGRMMVAEGSIIATNRWAYTLPVEAPYVYQSWLSELLLYGVWRLGDVPLLSLCRTFVITASYGLAVWHARRRAGPGWATLVALAIAVMVGWSNWTLRPQTLALLPGAAFVVVLSEYLAGRFTARWLAALPLLMVVWVNLHGSFVLGAALLALAWPGLAVAAWRSGGATGPAWRRLRDYTLASGGVLLALLVNPLGLGIVAYLRTMLTNAPLQRWFIEWQPPRLSLHLLDTGFWFFAMVLLLAVTLAGGRRRPTATDLLWYCALAWLAFGGVRYALWFGLLLLPLLAERLALLFPPRSSVRAHPAFSAALGGLLGILIILTLPWFGPARHLGANAEHLFATSGSHHWLMSNTTPIAATEWLAAHPIEGRFWADMTYTSYTIWRIPDKQVFADLRVELFPVAIWQDYFAIGRGDAASLVQLDAWQITHLMLDRTWQAALYARLAETPGWCERYADAQTVIMARCE